MNPTDDPLVRTLAKVRGAYEDTLARHGPTPRGVSWRDEFRQRLRFQVLLQLLDGEDEPGLTLAELGCGYGALFDDLRDLPAMAGGRYIGYDMCEAMLDAARKHTKDPRARFVHSAVPTQPAHYTFVSGTFNLKLDADPRIWQDYVLATLEILAEDTERGLAFNMLSSRDRDKNKALFYADHRTFVDFCRGLGRVTLIDDYPLCEWTILIHK